MKTYLDDILARKATEVESQINDPQWMDSNLAAASGNTKSDPPRGFARALRQCMVEGNSSIIAEIKQASPSRGLLTTSFDPATTAKAYQIGGAAALSVLTDYPGFKGTAEHLKSARTACKLPVLRKDFMIHPAQIIESRAMGADAILVIMAAVTDSIARELVTEAHNWGLDALLEIHDQRELTRAEALIHATKSNDTSPSLAGRHSTIPHKNTPEIIIGINNRNLSTFELDLVTTEQLAPQLKMCDHVLVCESGITTKADIKRINKAGVYAFLIGETLMRAADPANALQCLLK